MAPGRRTPQDTAGVPGTNDTVDRFGESLSAADITGDGIDDLAVGLPGKELGNDDDAGAVDILRGSRAGLTGKGAQSFTQDTAGVPGTAETHDAFGSAVELLDINGNGYADLARGGGRGGRERGGLGAARPADGHRDGRGAACSDRRRSGRRTRGRRSGPSSADRRPADVPEKSSGNSGAPVDPVPPRSTHW